MVAQHKVSASVDDRKKTEYLSIGGVVDYTWTLLAFGYIFLTLLWQWVSPVIDASWLMVEKWRVLLQYH